MHNRITKHLCHPAEQAASALMLLDCLRRCGVEEWRFESLRRHAEEILHDECHTDEAERWN